MNPKIFAKLVKKKFPFKYHGCNECKDMQIDCGSPYPTLSELIKECKERFGGLNYWPMCNNPKQRWVAYTERIINMKDPYNCREFVVYGATPEETVAELWLKLNK